jgi:hypothetical protein
MLDVTFGDDVTEGGFPPEPVGEPGTIALKACFDRYGTELQCGYVL